MTLVMICMLLSVGLLGVALLERILADRAGDEPVELGVRA